MEGYGLPKPDHEPLDAHPSVSGEFLTRVGCGDISPKGAMERLDGDGVFPLPLEHHVKEGHRGLDVGVEAVPAALGVLAPAERRCDGRQALAMRSSGRLRRRTGRGRKAVAQ